MPAPNPRPGRRSLFLLLLSLLLHPLAKAIYLAFLEEEKPHVSAAYSRPLGLNEGLNNLALLLRLQDSAIAFIRSTRLDLRTYFLNAQRPNVHQLYINQFGHIDRHIRQIAKVKAHALYPR